MVIIMHNKIVIIGCGNVGMSYAYALLNQPTKVDELVLIDIDKERIEGEVMDLNHSLVFAPKAIDIKVGDYSDCRDATIVCICAGAKQAKNESRLDLLEKNKKILKSIIDNVIQSSFDGIFLIATNPVDIMTYLTYRYSYFEKGKVIGSGTSLDTVRLRYLIGKQLNISPKNIHTYVIGEHGDSEFVPWSNAFVGSIKMEQLLNCETLESLASEVKNAAYEIINKKGATYYAIGMVLVRITNAILEDENTILTVSTYDENNNIYIGLPAIVNRHGVVGTIKIELTEEEREQYQCSVDVIKNEINKLISNKY
jgi:L-lactate dehydrogenase